MLKGKTVVITGGAKGIGSAVAVKFSEEGANIVINYRSNISEEFISRIEKNGVGCLTVKGDVSDFNTAKVLIDTAKEKFGTVDVLVNNAGITKDMLLIRMGEEDFDSVISTNLKGTFNTIRHASNVMLKQKTGTIINMTSVVGVCGNIGQANYAASKAGVIGLTKSCAKELASRGITVNAIAPGFIQTDMTENLSEDIKKKMIENIPLKRFGTIGEVASVAVFLAKNKYITGQVINIDGGMLMG